MRGSIGGCGCLSDAGVNWVDVDVMSDAGMNWANVGELSDEGSIGWIWGDE